MDRLIEFLKRNRALVATVLARFKLGKAGAWLDGKKSYLGAAGLALVAAYHLYEGDIDKAIEFGSAALGLFGLRSAIAKGGSTITVVEGPADNFGPHIGAAASWSPTLPGAGETSA